MKNVICKDVASELAALNDELQSLHDFLGILHDNPGDESVAEWGLTVAMEAAHNAMSKSLFIHYKTKVQE